MKKFSLLTAFGFALALIMGCPSPPVKPTPKKKVSDPNAVNKTLNATENMKDLSNEKLDEKSEKK